MVHLESHLLIDFALLCLGHSCVLHELLLITEVHVLLAQATAHVPEQVLYIVHIDAADARVDSHATLLATRLFHGRHAVVIRRRHAAVVRVTLAACNGKLIQRSLIELTVVVTCNSY